MKFCVLPSVGCRYEKGEWSQCVGGQITREDKLEPEATGGSDQNCNPVRTVSKKCKANGNSSGGKQHGQSRRTKEQKQKDKGKSGEFDPFVKSLIQILCLQEPVTFRLDNENYLFYTYTEATFLILNKRFLNASPYGLLEQQ